MEQIYSGEYFKDQQNGANSASGRETPNAATVAEDGEVEAECIELDTFEHNEEEHNNEEASQQEE